MGGEFSICHWNHLIVKPLFLAGLRTGTENYASAGRIKGKECSNRFAFTLNPQILHVAVYLSLIHI